MEDYAVVQRALSDLQLKRRLETASYVIFIKRPTHQNEAKDNAAATRDHSHVVKRCVTQLYILLWRAITVQIQLNSSFMSSYEVNCMCNSLKWMCPYSCCQNVWFCNTYPPDYFVEHIITACIHYVTKIFEVNININIILYALKQLRLFCVTTNT